MLMPHRPAKKPVVIRILRFSSVQILDFDSRKNAQNLALVNFPSTVFLRFGFSSLLAHSSLFSAI